MNKESKYSKFINFIKIKKNWTNKDIANKSNLPISKIDKISSGRTKKPLPETMSKIAASCGFDIGDMENCNDLKTCFIDTKTENLLKALNGNPLARSLCETTLNLKNDDIKIVIEVAKRIAKNDNK